MSQPPQPPPTPPPTRPQLPDDFEELDFVVEEEHWNEYELNDGARIKARMLLKKIMADPNNPLLLDFDISPILSTVYAPIALRGERNNAPTPQEYNTLPSFEMGTNRSDEQWNIYRILRSGRTVRLRATITRIRRIADRFDNDGLPFYILSSGPMIVVDPVPQQPGP